MLSDGILYEKVIYNNEAKFYELRLTVSEFRGIQYVNVRKYFLSYEGDYIPSKEGISMESSITNVHSLLEGLIELCSKEEARDLMTKYFGERISDLNKSA
jgi:hypothetical protein